MRARVGSISIGQRFGSWTVISLSEGGKTECKCGCGTVVKVDNYNLRHGKSTMCLRCAANRQTPCKGRQLVSHLPKEIYYKLSTRVSQAISRCTNPESSVYKSYGGRGIRVYKPWIAAPEKFILYLSTLPGFDDPNLWLDRIDNDRGYIPGNLRFVTPSQSGKNRRPVSNETKLKLKQSWIKRRGK